MTNCPCCSTPMLRHVSQQRVYWFCRNCWQEMPLVNPQIMNVVPVSLGHSFLSIGLNKELIAV